MANIGTLAAKLVLDPSVWMTGLDKAADRLNRFTSGIKHVIDEPAKGLGKLLAKGPAWPGCPGSRRRRRSRSGPCIPWARPPTASLPN